MSKLTACMILIATLGVAQTLDTGILGVVTDQGGAVVGNATVTITQPATGLSRSVTTGPEGNYEVRYLTPGEYTVSIQAPGFKTERRTGIVLQISQLARIDFSLQIGQVQETVEVTATSPILQTENAVIGEVVAAERIVNLPLNGRNFLQLSAMTPGVVVREESNGGTHTRTR